MQPHEIDFDLNYTEFRVFLRERFGDCVGEGHIPSLQYATDDELRAGKYLPNPGRFANGNPLDERAREFQVEFAHYSRRKFSRLWKLYQAEKRGSASIDEPSCAQFALI